MSGGSTPDPLPLANSPRVALVHDWLTGMRGGEKVLEAIAALYPQAPIYTLFHFPGTVSEALESHPIRTSWLQRAPGIRRHYRRFLPFFPAAVEDFDLSAYDLIISTSHCVAKGAIPRPDALHVCYCHTPMRYAWDQEHAYFPQRRGLVARLRSQALSRLRTWDVASSSRVDYFIANSSFVARRIRRYYGRKAEVIPPPVDLDFFSLSEESGVGSDRPEAYCLSVAALAPYKHHELAIEACRQLGVPLVIVGDGPARHELGKRAGSDVRLAGRVEGAELRDLYRHAAVFVQPGVEDFGMAAVEALACGTPIAAAGAGGILDIVQEDVHGFLFEPARGKDGLAEAIDKARSLMSNSLDLRAQAEQFSTPRFLQRMRDSLRNHISARSHRSTASFPRGSES